MNGRGGVQSALEIGETILSPLVFSRELEDVARHIAEALDVWECDLYEYFPESGQLVAAAAWAPEMTQADREWVGTTLRVAARPTYATVIHERRTCERHVDDPRLPVESRRFMEAWGEKSTIHVPLVYDGQVAGCLTLVEKREVRRFTAQDKQLLALIAVPAAVAVRNCALYREQEERNRQLDSLLESIRAMTSTATIEDVLDIVALKTAKALDVPSCCIYEYSPEDDCIIAQATYDADPLAGPAYTVGTPFALEEYPGDRAVLERGDAVQQLVSDPSLDAATRESMERNGEKSCLSVPLLFRDRLVGLLEIIETRYERVFTAAERELALGLGEQAGAAIQNARLYHRQQEQNRRLRSLIDASRALSSLTSLQEVLSAVVRLGAQGLCTRQCTVSEYDAATDSLVFRAGWDTVAEGGRQYWEEFTYPLDVYEGERAILQGREAVLEHVSDPRIDDKNRHAMLEWGEKTYLNVPLHYRDELIGMLAFVETEVERSFTEEEVAFARGLGEQTAIAIHNARRYQELAKATHQLHNELQVHHSLFELSEALLSALDQETVFKETANVLKTVVGYDTMEISLIDEDAAEIVEVFLGEGSVNETLGFRMPLGSGVAGSVLESGCAEMVNDMLHDPRAVQVPDTDEEEQASMVAPLQVGGRVIGVLAVSRFGGGVFAEREFELVKLITNFAAIAIQNARSFEEMAELAIHDGLTGLYNHRHFYERLDQEVARSQRYGAPVSLLMIDIDGFKRFNDAHGHLAGDEVLQEIARVLLGQVRRDVDIVARYGGEEFAVLLPSTPSQADPAAASGGASGSAALTVGERIRSEIENCDFEGRADGDHPLTVSVGIAALPDCAYDGIHLVQNADKALYVAKRLGKNRVEVYQA